MEVRTVRLSTTLQCFLTLSLSSNLCVVHERVRPTNIKVQINQLYLYESQTSLWPFLSHTLVNLILNNVLGLSPSFLLVTLNRAASCDRGGK